MSPGWWDQDRQADHGDLESDSLTSVCLQLPCCHVPQKKGLVRLICLSVRFLLDLLAVFWGKRTCKLRLVVINKAESRSNHVNF